MQPDIETWIGLYNVASAFEGEKLDFYRMAGAEGTDFEVLAMIEGVHREWQSEQAKAK